MADKQNDRLIVDCYTDVLCVWAWIAQRRNEELVAQWGEKIDLRYHYLNLFGDTASRIDKQWSTRGGYDGFGAHVVESAAAYDNAPVNADVWTNVRPASSATAHLVIKAATVVSGQNAANDFALEIRKAFFVDARNIGEMTVLYKIANDMQLDELALRQSIDNGTATAVLMNDYQQANEQNIAGSPSWVMNDGRQKLYGNVSYQVLNANVEGLLNRRGDEASWC